MDSGCDYIAMLEFKLGKFIKEHSNSQILIVVNDDGLSCLKNSPNFRISTKNEYFYRDIKVLLDNSISVTEQDYSILTEEEYKGEKNGK